MNKFFQSTPSNYFDILRKRKVNVVLLFLFRMLHYCSVLLQRECSTSIQITSSFLGCGELRKEYEMSLSREQERISNENREQILLDLKLASELEEEAIEILQTNKSMETADFELARKIASEENDSRCPKSETNNSFSVIDLATTAESQTMVPVHPMKQTLPARTLSKKISRKSQRTTTAKASPLNRFFPVIGKHEKNSSRMESDGETRSPAEEKSQDSQRLAYSFSSSLEDLQLTWQCNQCTFQNNILLTECEMCNYSKNFCKTKHISIQ